MPSPTLTLTLLFTASFGLAAWLEPRRTSWAEAHGRSDSLLGVLLGDSRRLFATHFFTKADVYFHSGYYPTIFDSQEGHRTPHIAGDAGAMEDRNVELASGFLPPPRDWIDRFSRHFFPSQHTHLEQTGLAREILPWLRFSASLDPQRVETYTVAAYWLRYRLQRPEAAFQFLLEGWRANPDSFEIIFELGRLQDENFKDPRRARNLYELALRRWHAQEDHKREPNLFLYLQIVAHLARLEEHEGHRAEARRYLELLKQASPHPEQIQKQIDELK